MWEVVVGHLCEGVTIAIDSVDAPVGKEGEFSHTAEDITEGGFGRQRLQSNCTTKRHCVGVEV